MLLCACVVTTGLISTHSVHSKRCNHLNILCISTMWDEMKQSTHSTQICFITQWDLRPISYAGESKGEYIKMIHVIKNQRRFLPLFDYCLLPFLFLLLLHLDHHRIFSKMFFSFSSSHSSEVFFLWSVHCPRPKQHVCLLLLLLFLYYLFHFRMNSQIKRHEKNKNENKKIIIMDKFKGGRTIGQYEEGSWSPVREDKNTVQSA